MSSLLGRLLVPLRAARPRAPAPAFPPRALVLGREQDAPALAAALAGELRARASASAALISVWGPQPLGPLAAAPGAHSLAGRLERRALPAVARGRLAWLPLAGDPAGALALGLRAAAAVDVPAVLAVAGPRPRELEPALGEFDLIVVAEPAGDPGTASFAVESLAAAGVGAVACAPPCDAARLVALAGWGRLRRMPELRELAAALA